MKTPVCDFVKDYADKESLRLHMPGHKGRAFLGCERYDITEIEGADVLYSAEGIIAQSRQNASELFGSGKTLYSTEGSSLCIRAMVYLVKVAAQQRGEKAKILAFRNAHKTFITASALLDVQVQWIYGEEGEGIVCCNASGETVEKELSLLKEQPTAIYVTSPDYLGNIADIRGISDLCKERGILLIVDNAHGAYLNFLPESRHPLSLGAHMCCDSAHKTLPVLTGGAYLHISQNAPKLLAERAEYALSLFATTSPSFLIIQSLDRANAYLSDGYEERLSDFCLKLSEMKARLISHGYTFVGDEPLKLTIKAKEYGYKGTEIGEYLLKKDIVCDFYDPDYTVMMLTPENTDGELVRLEKALKELKKRNAIKTSAPSVTKPEKALPLNEALYMPVKKVRVRDSIGEILGSVSVSCPPAIPVMIMGERIGEKEVELLRYYGIEECEVID